MYRLIAFPISDDKASVKFGQNPLRNVGGIVNRKNCLCPPVCTPTNIPQPNNRIFP